jgi:penicillin-binding protein 2
MSLSRIFTTRKNKNKNTEIDPEDIFMESLNVSAFSTHELEGRFEKSIQPNVFLFLAAGFVCIFLICVYKAYAIQIRDQQVWSDRAVKNYIRKTPVFAYRGVIKDVNGKLLAWNEYLDATTTAIAKREYMGPGFSNLLGYVKYPQKDSSGVFWQDEYIGEDGLEKQYDKQLQGEKGARIVEVAANGKPIRDNLINKPTDGAALDTYIDSRVQKAFYNRLKEVVDAQGFRGGAAVMMDIHTGGVVALVSYPEYDNNVFTNATTSIDKQKKQDYLTSKKTPMLDRPVSGLFTPGSTVKPYIAYAALNEGVIDEYKNIYSSGQLVIKNVYGGPDTIFKDWKAHGYVNVRKALEESSDEYFYQVGGGYKDQPGLGIKRIEQYANFFGFASSTGIDMPQENSGIVPSIEWKKKSFKDGDWLLGDTYHTSIGQYGFQLTPLELVRGVAAIANGGLLVTPKVASTTSQDNRVVDLHLNQKYIQVIREGMRLAAGIDGTAHYFTDLPFEIAAKTGTAQLGYNNEYVNSWSTGYWPYKNPKYAYVFLMEYGPHTNTVAASKIMREVFGDIVENAPEYTK